VIQYFKNVNQKTIQVDIAEAGTWINVLPPLKQEEFT
jgi:magnesium transporter